MVRLEQEHVHGKGGGRDEGVQLARGGVGY